MVFASVLPELATGTTGEDGAAGDSVSLSSITTDAFCFSRIFVISFEYEQWGEGLEGEEIAPGVRSGLTLWERLGCKYWELLSGDVWESASSSKRYLKVETI